MTPSSRWASIGFSLLLIFGLFWTKFTESNPIPVLPKEVSIPLPPSVFLSLSRHEKKCLVENIYFESRNQPALGQAAVAWATVNRAMNTQTSLCEQVFRKAQFSWTLVRSHLYLPYHNDRAWIEANKIANEVLEGQIPDFTEGATYYHTRSVSPDWDKTLQQTVTIGDHVFFRT